MVRIYGFEQIAQEHGHAGEFYTVTCPGRMHARLSKTGNQNTRYDGTAPRQTQQYLGKQWNKVRAKFKRMGISVYGYRVAEPQHDGTPHWDMLLFMPPEHVDQVRAVLLHYALEHDADDPGTAQHRFKAVAID